MSFVAI